MNGAVIQTAAASTPAPGVLQLIEADLEKVAGGAYAYAADGSGGCWTVWTGNGFDWNCFWIE